MSGHQNSYDESAFGRCHVHPGKVLHPALSLLEEEGMVRKGTAGAKEEANIPPKAGVWAS